MTFRYAFFCLFICSQDSFIFFKKKLACKPSKSVEQTRILQMTELHHFFFFNTNFASSYKRFQCTSFCKRHPARGCKASCVCLFLLFFLFVCLLFFFFFFFFFFLNTNFASSYKRFQCTSFCKTYPQEVAKQVGFADFSFFVKIRTLQVAAGDSSAPFTVKFSPQEIAEHFFASSIIPTCSSTPWFDS